MRGNPISEEQRKRMYELFLTGQWTQRALADQFGCSEWAASQVISSQLTSKLRKDPKPVHHDPLPKSKYRSRGGMVDIPSDKIKMEAHSIAPKYNKQLKSLSRLKSQ